MAAIERISLTVDGAAVNGEITVRWSRFVQVRLVEPVGPLSSSCSVPLFAVPHVDLTGARGDAVALGLLRELYETAVVLDRHRRELSRRWLGVQHALADLAEHDPDRPSALSSERSELRRQFCAGEIDQTGYQRGLKGLRARGQRHDKRVIATYDLLIEPSLWSDDIHLSHVIEFVTAASTLWGVRRG